MLRILLIFHRYTAVTVGLLMALWCLSGFVMLYQQYPQLTDAERLRGLTPLQLQGCCRTQFLPVDGEGEVRDFRIEMLRGTPVLRQRGPAFALTTGTPLRRPTRQELLQIAATHAANRGLGGEPRWLGDTPVDQWTLLAARRNQSIAHVSLDDGAGTELYLNGATGEVFQDTNRRERVLAWVGAIPHWLYFIALRRNGPLWTQIVIWTSVLGTFLTLTGLYVGISRLQRRKGDGALASPFRGWWYWHHLAGLVFGALTLTWVFSGLLTMNPWGLLEGSDVASQVVPRLSGSAPVAEMRRFLNEAPAKLAGGGFVRLRSQPFAGHLYVLAERADGSTVRLDDAGEPAPLREADLRAALSGIETGLEQLTLLREDDAYYYSHKQKRELPVWRATLADAQRTRVYISPSTAELRIVDGDARAMRWLERGLHGLDFAGLRARPLWDILIIVLLLGVTGVCITGSWMALQRIRKDLSRS